MPGVERRLPDRDLAVALDPDLDAEAARSGAVLGALSFVLPDVGDVAAALPQNPQERHVDVDGPPYAIYFDYTRHGFAFLMPDRESDSRTESDPFCSGIMALLGGQLIEQSRGLE